MEFWRFSRRTLKLAKYAELAEYKNQINIYQIKFHVVGKLILEEKEANYVTLIKPKIIHFQPTSFHHQSHHNANFIGGSLKQ